MRTEVLLENRNRCFILEDTSQTFMEQYVLSILTIGHLHDGVILLLRPESFSFFLSNLNLVIPVRVKQQKSQFAQESKTLKDSGHSSKMTSSCKCPILHAVQF